MPLIEESLNKIKSEKLSKEEIMQAMRTMVEFVKQIKASNLENNQRLDTQYQTTFSRLLSDLKGSGLYKELMDTVRKEAGMSVEEFKNTTGQSIKGHIDGLTKREKEMLANLDIKMGDMKKALSPDVDGITSNASKKTYISLVPIIKNVIKKGIGLYHETLEKRIDDLEERIKKLGKSMSSSMLGGGGGVGKFNVVYYDLSGSLDGATKTFSLPAFREIIDIKLSSVPVMRKDTDYTVSGNSITFTDEITLNDLSSGQSCIVLYSET